MDWMKKTISNLYKMKWREEESKYINEEESSVTIKLKVVGRLRDKNEEKKVGKKI